MYTSGVRRFLRVASFIAAFAGAIVGKADSLERLEAIAAKAPSLAAFLSDRALVSDYRKALASYLGTDLHDCESFDEVVRKLGILTKSTSAFSASLWEPAWGTRSLTIAAGKTKEERFVLRAVPRKFHAIWIEMSGQSCPDNECRDTDRDVPERWIVGLRDSQVYLLENGSRYAGAAIARVAVRRGTETLDLVYPFGESLDEERDLWQTFPERKFRSSLLAHWLTTELTYSQRRLAVIRPDSSPSGRHKVVDATDFLSSQSRDLGDISNFSPEDHWAMGVAKALPRRCSVKAASAETLLFSVAEAPGSTGGSSPTSFAVSVPGTGNPRSKQEEKLSSLPPGLQAKDINVKLQIAPGGKSAAAKDKGAVIRVGDIGPGRGAIELPALTVSGTGSPRLLGFSGITNAQPSVASAAPSLGSAQSPFASADRGSSAASGSGSEPKRQLSSLTPSDSAPQDAGAPKAGQEGSKLPNAPAKNPVDPGDDFRRRAARLDDIQNPAERKKLVDELRDEWNHDRRGELLDDLGKLKLSNKKAAEELVRAIQASATEDAKQCPMEQARRKGENP